MPPSEPPRSSDDGESAPLVRVRPPGPMSVAWAARLERSESPSVGARRESRADIAGAEMAPIVFASGVGSNVFDVDGNRYVDLAAGFGSLLLGHGPLQVARAVARQADRLWMALGDLYPSDVKIALTERAAELYPARGARVLLGQSGSDAVGAALKTAKLATGKPGVVAFDGAYHGLGHGPLAACGLKESWRAAFADQLNPHVVFAPYPESERRLDESLSSVERALAKGAIGAVLVEPILGRGGIVVPPQTFLAELRRLTLRHRALLIADEIWTGLGRAGHMVESLSQLEGSPPPDVLCFGKGLGGGMPVSACVGSEDVMRAWRREPSEEVVHTGTFFGSPLACAAALATLEALRADKLEERSRTVGERAKLALRTALEALPGAGPVRGAGLMIGVALGSGATALALQRFLLEKGYIVTLGGLEGEVLVITPALNVAERLLEDFALALRSLLDGPSPVGAPGEHP